MGRTATIKASASRQPAWRARLFAWWHGVDFTSRQQMPVSHAGDEVETSESEASYWAVGQKVWGEGRNGPGELVFLDDLVKPLKLARGKQMLYLGAGLGGGARRLVSEQNANLVAYERDPRVARTGCELSDRAELARDVPINHLDPANIRWPKRHFDGAIGVEFLFNLPNMNKTLVRIERALKPGSNFVFVDFVLGDDIGAEDEEIVKWGETEPWPPTPCGVSELEQVVEKSKFQVISMSDVSETYIDAVSGAWSKAAQELPTTLKAEAEQPEGWMEALVAECQRWATRTTLLETGKLKVYRVHALAMSGLGAVPHWRD